jgi:hypothetical protein
MITCAFKYSFLAISKTVSFEPQWNSQPSKKGSSRFILDAKEAFAEVCIDSQDSQRQPCAFCLFC